MDFTLKLLSWYRKNKRDLPWRSTKNPYYIWLSEIILQQTKVDQGLPYYLHFTEKYPLLENLALANEDDVLKSWQGLGYYSRARNLHATAKTIYFDLDNKFPETYNEIIKLKGIGPYTAAAIASFAFKEKVAVVDGNVYRVLARYFGIYDDITATKTRKTFQDLANELIPNDHPDLFNHAIMDFGATVCTPNNPLCESCILNNNCYAFLNNKTTDLPVKSKQIKTKNRYLNYLILRKNNQIAINQRTAKDIWQQLYQLPLLETPNNIDIEVFDLISNQFPNQTIKKINPNTIKHKLSHQNLFIDFYEIEVDKISKNYTICTISELYKYAYPIVIWNFLKDFFKLENF